MLSISLPNLSIILFAEVEILVPGRGFHPEKVKT